MYDQTRISFLDVWISISGHAISMCTFRKDTSANTLLHADHPRWLKDIVPVGQFLRIKHNCTNQLNIGGRVKTSMEGSGNKAVHILKRAKNKVAKCNREDLLEIPAGDVLARKLGQGIQGPI